MNDKTVKLIRKYSGRAEEDRKSILRRWRAMTQAERRRFRQKMETLVRSED